MDSSGLASGPIKICLFIGYIIIYFIIHFLLLDNSIAYMFIHTARAYAHILLHKMDGSKRNILKGTVKGNTPGNTTPCRR